MFLPFFFRLNSTWWSPHDQWLILEKVGHHLDFSLTMKILRPCFACKQNIFSLLSYPLFVIMKCSFHHCISYLYLLVLIVYSWCWYRFVCVCVCVCVIYIYIPAVHVYGRFLMNFFFLSECIRLDLLSLIIQDKRGQTHHKTIFLLV